MILLKFFWGDQKNENDLDQSRKDCFQLLIFHKVVGDPKKKVYVKCVGTNQTQLSHEGNLFLLQICDCFYRDPRETFFIPIWIKFLCNFGYSSRLKCSLAASMSVEQWFPINFVTHNRFKWKISKSSGKCLHNAK